MTAYATTGSPLGELLLVGEETPTGLTLSSLSLPGQKNASAVQPGWRHAPGLFADVERQLAAYFAGEPTDFDIAFTPGGGSERQRRVWRALEEIPYGTTTSYGALAERLGFARADVRALGGAIGANPLLVVRPCHRVIGADGSLRGYAGGLERKRQLLTLEGVLQPMLGG